MKPALLGYVNNLPAFLSLEVIAERYKDWRGIMSGLPAIAKTYKQRSPKSIFVFLNLEHRGAH
ncbi:hypothetical protein ABXJ76_04690 [Methylobacter sp. G7]|uniref:hypothetical protein n=1 Tax=Methylobacter sp. G7 TaxID=3230117 RepID=UPI003D80672B